MSKKTVEDVYKEVIEEVAKSGDITVAVDNDLKYIAVNEAACKYLKIEAKDLLGKTALQLYPEITASRNHRNILKALSGVQIKNELIESRMGDFLLTTYKPVIVEGQVRAVILIGKLQDKSDLT